MSFAEITMRWWLFQVAPLLLEKESLVAEGNGGGWTEPESTRHSDTRRLSSTAGRPTIAEEAVYAPKSPSAARLQLNTHAHASSHIFNISLITPGDLCLCGKLAFIDFLAK